MAKVHYALTHSRTHALNLTRAHMEIVWPSIAARAFLSLHVTNGCADYPTSGVDFWVF